jgi:DNA-3-methyladenine glycosylase
MRLERSFYTRSDVVQIAKDLIGKYLYTSLDGGITGGIITETEAYEGVTDRASHAYGGRRTARTGIMFRQGGTAYIYLCYGVHSLFNIVTNIEGVPHAVLIRGIKPVTGLDIMSARIGKSAGKPGIGIGPGKVSKLLGMHFSQTGEDLLGDNIWLEDRGLSFQNEIMTGPRIGVDYARQDALLPYRFRIDAEFVNKKRGYPG